MEKKVLAIINEIRTSKDLPALSVLKSTDNLRDDLELTSFDLAELTVKIEDEFEKSPEIDYIINFIRNSERGIIK